MRVSLTPSRSLSREDYGCTPNIENWAEIRRRVLVDSRAMDAEDLYRFGYRFTV
jgi:hypothetical protein